MATQVDAVGIDVRLLAQILASRDDVEIREGDANTIYALAMDTPDPFYYEGMCGQPSCTIQRIDVAERSVVDSITFASARQYALLRPDVHADGLAVIAADSAPFLYASDAGTGFDVHYMAL